MNAGARYYRAGQSCTAVIHAHEEDSLGLPARMGSTAAAAALAVSYLHHLPLIFSQSLPSPLYQPSLAWLAVFRHTTPCHAPYQELSELDAAVG